jgi:hypothetical protein
VLLLDHLVDTTLPSSTPTLHRFLMALVLWTTLLGLPSSTYKGAGLLSATPVAAEVAQAMPAAAQGVTNLLAGVQRLMQRAS